MNKHLVAVYGTLMRGYGLHSLLESSEFVGNGILPHHYLVHHGGFPGAKSSGNLPRLSEEILPLMRFPMVEVYEIDDNTLQRLDRAEGVPSLYTREATDIIDDDGNVIFEDVYFYLSQVGDHDPVIVNGNFREPDLEAQAI